MFRPQLTLGIAVLACGSLILCAVAADPKLPAKPDSAQAQPAEPTAVNESQLAGEVAPAVAPVAEEESFLNPDFATEDKGPWEVTDKVELVYRSKLEAAGAKTLTAKVMLKNKSEADIPGKLVLVIDGSTVPGTKLRDSNGQFSETTPYIQIVPAKRKLETGDESPVKTVVLESETPTKELVLESPELRWRVFTLTKPDNLDNEPPADEKKVPGKDYTWGDMRKVMSVQSKATENLVSQHNGAILGTATSEDANGKLIIQVYAARGGMSRKLPGSIEGIPVEVEVTGTITAGPAKSRVVVQDGKAVLPDPTEKDAAFPSKQAAPNASIQVGQAGPPTRRFIRPVPIGVSTINQTDVCASGTLGCRCIGRDGRLYVLSNNHVFSKQNAGLRGQTISQPSTGDLPLPVQCDIIPTDVIATLFDFQPVGIFPAYADFPTGAISIMDAAVGLTPIGQVDVGTVTEGYGIPARSPQENYFIGMPVQKYGRTTRFTKGKIYGMNAEIVLAYSTGFARFRSCINVQTQNRLPAFGGPGDSGSLVVTIADRRPVGLLFAGGGFNTYLNPISPILSRFKMGVDDGTGSPPIIGSGRMGNASGPVTQDKNARLN